MSFLRECVFREAKGFLHRSSFIPPIYSESRVTCAACVSPSARRVDPALASLSSIPVQHGERECVPSEPSVWLPALSSLPLNILLWAILTSVRLNVPFLSKNTSLLSLDYISYIIKKHEMFYLSLQSSPLKCLGVFEWFRVLHSCYFCCQGIVMWLLGCCECFKHSRLTKNLLGRC